MLRRSPQVELRRRLVVYYLFTGLATAVLVSLAAVHTMRTLLGQRSLEVSLNRLGWAAGILERAYEKGGVAAVQAQVPQVCAAALAYYCAVVSPEGKYAAHTTARLLGQEAPEPLGERRRWGNVEHVRFRLPSGELLHEYRLPLRPKELGTLRLGIREPHWWEVSLTVLGKSPMLVGLPVALILGGGLVLSRTVRSASSILEQLAGLVHEAELRADLLQPVAGSDAGAAGWNRLVAYLRDMGSHRPAQGIAEAVRGYQQRRADLVLESLPDGLAVTDTAARIRYANPSFKALSNGHSGDLRGLSVLEALGLSEADPKLRLLVDPETQGKPVATEVSFPGPNGSSILRIHRVPLRSEGTGLATGHVWLVRDITQQKLAEQMRNQFVYSATHELRTPLANIRAYAETLACSPQLDIEKQKEFCNIINSEAVRLSKLIDDLLNISRMGAGAMVLDVQPTDLARLVEDVIIKVRPGMEKKNITFQTILPEKYFPVELDKQKVAVTLINLLGNAMKYTPEGGKVLFRVDQTESEVQFVVQDTGIGIAPEELPRIFEKFYRSSDPRVKDITGSGLGLALAKEIVDLHGGQITVESKLNEGSTFTVTLPARPR
jgi:PAS domain S-box-containing protein